MKSQFYLLLVLFPLMSFCQEDSFATVSELQGGEVLEFLAVDEKDLNLEFETINESLFSEYKSNYDDKITYDSSKVVDTEKSLYIKTLAGEYHLQGIEYPNSAEYSFYSYAGFLKPLNLHFYNTSGRMYEHLMAIDCFTGERFSVDHFYKFNFFDFLLSKEDDQLLTYISEGDTGTGSTVKIFQLEAKKAVELRVFSSEEWNIDELVWIDKNSFALKTYTEETLDKTQGKFVRQNIQYLKATIIE